MAHYQLLYRRGSGISCRCNSCHTHKKQRGVEGNIGSDSALLSKICEKDLRIGKISLPLRRIKYLIKNTKKMKKGIHPENYRLVAFKDMSNDHVFLCRSAVSTKETIEVNGETYPVYKMEISNTSHPFYTGKIKLVDTAGRVDKFMSRYAKRYDKKNK